MPDLLTGAAHDAPISVRSESERLVEIRIAPWGVVGNTAEGPEILQRGAFRGTRPDEVALEAIGPHGAAPGVTLAGRAVELEDREDGGYGVFRVSRTRAGDELLELARDRVYRAASPCSSQSPRPRASSPAYSNGPAFGSAESESSSSAPTQARRYWRFDPPEEAPCRAKPNRSRLPIPSRRRIPRRIPPPAACASSSTRPTCSGGSRRSGPTCSAGWRRSRPAPVGAAGPVSLARWSTLGEYLADARRGSRVPRCSWLERWPTKRPSTIPASCRRAISARSRDPRDRAAGRRRDRRRQVARRFGNVDPFPVLRRATSRPSSRSKPRRKRRSIRSRSRSRTDRCQSKRLPVEATFRTS